MLISFTDALADAERRDVAIGAFTAYNLETASAVLAAADKRDVPVILLVSDNAFRTSYGAQLLGALVAVAQAAGARCCVQLDHATDVDVMQAAVAAGAGAVLADGSKLPHDANVALVRSAADFAPGVEAELGRVSGDEDASVAAARGALTDPGQAADFVERTGAACLAVSIGNVHGRYREAPQLDWERLRAIRDRVSVPLSLHGASGLPDDDVRKAVSMGVRKVNVNTELRDRWFAVMEEQAPQLREGANLLALGGALIEGVQEVAAAKLDLLTGC